VGAFFGVIFNLPAPTNYPSSFDILNSIIAGKDGDLLFVIALMGWMPIAIDMSTWHSLWIQARIKQTGYHPSLKETLLDFNIGYIITVVLAICFLTIGSYVLFNNPEYTTVNISNMSAINFSKMLVDVFSIAVGDWSRPVIAIATFATMIGTSITLIDGYCRSIERTIGLLKTEKENIDFDRKQYLMWVSILIIGSYTIFYFFVSKLGTIINIAMTISFVLAPLFAYFNYKLIYNKEIDKTFHPPKWLKLLAKSGIVFLLAFTLLFLYSRIF
jgi:Mn2+/Fe2+ NRAMP family transporter